MNAANYTAFAVVLLVACSGGDRGSDGTSKVFKYAGKTQCEDDGVSVEDMERELTDAGIAVQCSQQAGDGYAYPACCGCASGLINVYEISPRDFFAAQQLGFESVSTLPDYEDSVCEPSNE